MDCNDCFFSCQRCIKEIYKELLSKDSINLDFDESFYKKYSRVLAVLDSRGLISKRGVLGTTIPVGVYIADPSYIIYMSAICEDSIKMQNLIDIVDECEDGKWLHGETIKNIIDLPLSVIEAVFDIYESKGFGICSKDSEACSYMGNT